MGSGFAGGKGDIPRSQGPQGLLPSSNYRCNSPTSGSSKEDQGVIPPVCPHTVSNEVFVEHNWTSAVKIVVLLVNYFQN